jgi:hypothetical protein
MYNEVKVFSSEEEVILSEYLKLASKLHRGLRSRNVCTLAYQCVKENNQKYPEKWKKGGKAGCGWLRKFMVRNRELSL